jgi:putative phosphoesterase
MRILVLSDCHGSLYKLQKAIEAQPDAKNVFYLGDGVSELEEIESLYPDRIFHKVKGNCDWGSDLPTQGIATVNGTKIFFTHGHKSFVKQSTAVLRSIAENLGAKIALYGHTHIANVEYENGIYCVNPGALSGSRNGSESYAVIDILPGGIMPIIIKI